MDYTSEVMVSDNGRFVYAGNRLHDGISIFSVGPSVELTVCRRGMDARRLPAQLQYRSREELLVLLQPKRRCDHHSPTSQVSALLLCTQPGQAGCVGQNCVTSLITKRSSAPLPRPARKESPGRIQLLVERAEEESGQLPGRKHLPKWLLSNGIQM